jgi:hypothetical protein
MENNEIKQQDDLMLQMCKMRGSVPLTCVLNGQIVMLRLKTQVDPCTSCDEDRSICKGRQK